MEKIKLSDGTIINISEIDLVNGVLNISTYEHTVEELVEMFSNKEKTNLIIVMSDTGVENGRKLGFTSFGGIHYGANGLKTVELFQPVSDLEHRVAEAEGKITQTNAAVEAVDAELDEMAEAIQEGVNAV